MTNCYSSYCVNNKYAPFVYEQQVCPLCLWMTSMPPLSMNNKYAPFVYEQQACPLCIWATSMPPLYMSNKYAPFVYEQQVCPLCLWMTSMSPLSMNDKHAPFVYEQWLSIQSDLRFRRMWLKCEKLCPSMPPTPHLNTTCLIQKYPTKNFLVCSHCVTFWKTLFQKKSQHYFVHWRVMGATKLWNPPFQANIWPTQGCNWW